MSSLLISDLHLQRSNPLQIELAQRLFQTEARGYDNLYILGDFVEYWLGDDSYDSVLESTFTAVKELAISGTTVHLMHGNRDFLFGQQFADKYSISLIREDETILQDEGQEILLMHGDTLCTDDEAYQNLRTMLRNEQWQDQFLTMSIEQRILAADKLRDMSKEETRGKSQEIMDVNADAVASSLKRNNLHTLVHGHTHRPAVHNIELDNNSGQRVVLGDWSTDGAYIASLRNSKLELFKWPKSY